MADPVNALTPLPIALCNEVLGERPFAAQCAYAAALGYDGIELAPYTIDDAPHAMSAAKRAEVRRAAADAGVGIASLHWLLVTPEGLSITTEEAVVRDRTIDIMRRHIGLAADLGAGILVHGSPGQRRLPDDPARAADARRRAIDAFAAIAGDAEAAGVVYCIEALGRPQANFINTVAEAADVVDTVGSPAVRTMIDCSAAGRTAEEKPVNDLIEHWMARGYIAHVQLNDSNRRAPGQGEDRFGPVLDALARHRYAGWLAVEPLVHDPDGPATAAFAIGYLKGLRERAVGNR